MNYNGVFMYSILSARNTVLKYLIRKEIPTMIFRGRSPGRTNIVADYNFLEQVLQFNYLSCDISCRKDHNGEKKLNKFNYTCRTTRLLIKNKS